MYQAALFDMDGVVADTEASVTDFWQRLAREHGRRLSPGDLEENVYGHRAEHTFKTLFPEIPTERYPEFYKRLREDQENMSYKAIPGVLEVLARLRGLGIPLALVTGAQDWKMAEVVRQLGLDKTFSVRICADDVTAGKPDPECYLQAARRLTADIARCVVFEDALSGVAAAVAAGAACVAITTQPRARQVRNAGAVVSTRDFTGVTVRRRDRTLRVADRAEFSFSEPQK